MPRQAKEKTEEKTKKVVAKKTTIAKKEPVKKATTKKTTSKKASEPKEKKVAKTSTKKTSTSKKTTTTKKEPVKKSATKKASTKKASESKEKKSIKKPKVVINEYYDLPLKYNKTVVTLLAQTPKTLFVYWEISDEDIKKYKLEFGENFFETTRPILIIHNDSFNYSFEVEINDFANSWYLHVNDSKSNYRIELGRKYVDNNNYVYITSSNGIESPNDHILFDTLKQLVFFRNVKTGYEFGKDITTLSYLKNIGKLYSIYDLYKELYKDEENIDDFSNPSSNSSSNMSSKFN